MLTSAIEQLFHHQVETDARVRYLFTQQSEYQSVTDERMRYLYFKQQEMNGSLRKVIRTQNVQKVTSLVNAFIGCFPLIGGISAHLISGGATVMTEVAGEGFGVSGLVESIFGIGKDLSSFVTEPVAEHFLKAGKKVLAEDAWDKLPAEKKAVVDATKELGITIGDLRARIDAMLDPSVVGESAFVKAEPGSSIIKPVNIESALATIRVDEVADEEASPETPISQGQDDHDSENSQVISAKQTQKKLARNWRNYGSPTLAVHISMIWHPRNSPRCWLRSWLDTIEPWLRSLQS